MKTENAEQSKLAESEATIERNQSVFYEIGLALRQIRDARLYQSTHSTFEKYCKQRWDMSRRQSYRLIEAAQVLENLCPIGHKLDTVQIGNHGSQFPRTEAQARELVGLTPDQQREVWQKAVETVPDGKPTAAHIRETREALLNSPEQEELFTAEDYRQAVDHHVHEGYRYTSLADYHFRQARHLRDEAFEKFGIQIPLPFDDQNSD